MGKKSLWFLLLALVAAFAALSLWPKQHHHHQMPPLPARLDPAVLADLGRSYDHDIKPVFQGACFDCHTKNTVWPWYHSVPGVRQFLDGHVEDGRRALDLSAGFPFEPGPKVLLDLRRIAGNVERGSMPLASYKLMHPLARLSDAQRQLIVRWARDGYDRLTETAQAGPAGVGHGKAPGKHPRHAEAGA